MSDDSQPSPRAMLRPRLLGSKVASVLSPLSAAKTALNIKKESGSREAIEYLIGKLGLEVSSDLDETYLGEAINYQLGSLFAYGLEPEKMAEHIRLSRTMPAPDDDLLFSDHVNASRFTNYHQKRGIERRIPPILVSCMPRSASATFTHMLGKVFDIPVLHLSIGRFPNYFLAPSWLDMFLEGGAITQDHFGANDFNTGVLSARGERDMFVLIRDPRAAARSYVHYVSGAGTDSDQPLEARIEQACEFQFIPWLQNWIDLSKSSSVPLRIHWITFREIREDPAAALRKLVGVLQERYASLSAYADCLDVPDLRIHYVSGNDEEWRTEVGEATRRRLWDACTPEIRSLLTLSP
jgi:hypothetical protein